MLPSTFLVTLAGFASVAHSELKQLHKRSAGYAPVTRACPNSTFVRPASSGIGTNEQTYFNARKSHADTSLKAWLNSVGFTAAPTKYPSVALAISGGGYRSMLEGAGVIQAFDSRDSKTGVSGIYQSLTYQAGLSGGSWLLSSIAGNNWPTISSLKTGLWATALNGTLDYPGGINYTANEKQIVEDILSKSAAGFPVSDTDPWGRLLSYQLLYGPDGGTTDTLFGITFLSNFTAQNVPYPIITSIGTYANQCLPLISNPQFELHPYEFGSWDSGVGAFIQTQYIGTNMTNGLPTAADACVTGYDNLGFVLGTSSNLFSDGCAAVAAGVTPSQGIEELIAGAQAFLTNITVDVSTKEFALYPNPFQGYTISTAASNLSQLHLVDGGISNQNDPIWPFIQPSRNGTIDVLIVNDNSDDTDTLWPNGTQIYNTYLQSKAHGLTRMPSIPPASTFVSEGLNRRATFFGCNNSGVLTVIYLPNFDFTYPSNISTFAFQYSPINTTNMISNGNAIATQNGSSSWPQCLACAIMENSVTSLPSNCSQCFSQYCYNPSNNASSTVSSAGSTSSVHSGSRTAVKGGPLPVLFAIALALFLAIFLY